MAHDRVRCSALLGGDWHLLLMNLDEPFTYHYTCPPTQVAVTAPLVFSARARRVLGRPISIPCENETARKQSVCRMQIPARPEFRLPDKRRKHPPAQRDRRPI